MDARVGAVRIAEARARDALAIRALHRSVLEEGSWFVRTADELPRLDTIEQDLGRYRVSDNSAWFVARGDGDAVVGMLTLTGGALARTRHVARLEMMVDRRQRGQGIGSVLLDHGIAWAAANPMIEKVGLNVFADNDRAIALYRSRGFVDEGRRVGEYREGERMRDDLLLALLLSRPPGRTRPSIRLPGGRSSAR